MASAAVAMKPKAWMKSANLYSLCSLPLTTVHPLRAETAFFSLGPESFGMLLLSAASSINRILGPAQRLGSVLLGGFLCRYSDLDGVRGQDLILFRCVDDHPIADFEAALLDRLVGTSEGGLGVEQHFHRLAVGSGDGHRLVRNFGHGSADVLHAAMREGQRRQKHRRQRQQHAASGDDFRVQYVHVVLLHSEIPFPLAVLATHRDSSDSSFA